MKLLILALAVVSAFGQGVNVPRYIAYKASTSVTSEKVTIQQVTGGSSKNVHFDKVVVQCTTACVVTLAQNGTAAANIALTITPVNLSQPTRSVAFSSSDVGAGTTLSTYNNPAAGILTLDVSQLYISRNAGSGNNFSVGVTCASGDVKIQINWTEE